MKWNYHTHTTRCHHADGTDEAYVQAAIQGGFDILGFADHAPWPFANGFVSRIRMGYEDFPDYVASVQALKKQYAGQIEIHLGLESEYFPRYRDHMLRMRDAGVEYFILGHHYCDSEEDNPYAGNECMTDDGVRRYADTLAKAVDTGLFCYVAHPDLFMRHRMDEDFNRCCEEASDTICQAAMEAGLPLEYNLEGLRCIIREKTRGYPSRPFWEYARKWNNPVILGVDAHSPDALSDHELWQKGQQDVRKLGYTFLDSFRAC